MTTVQPAAEVQPGQTIVYQGNRMQVTTLLDSIDRKCGVHVRGYTGKKLAEMSSWCIPLAGMVVKE